MPHGSPPTRIVADGRNRRAVQTVTTTRLEQIRARLADLTLHEILDALLERCLATRHTHPHVPDAHHIHRH